MLRPFPPFRNWTPRTGSSDQEKFGQINAPLDDQNITGKWLRLFSERSRRRLRNSHCSLKATPTLPNQAHLNTTQEVGKHLTFSLDPNRLSEEIHARSGNQSSNRFP